MLFKIILLIGTLIYLISNINLSGISYNSKKILKKKTSKMMLECIDGTSTLIKDSMTIKNHSLYMVPELQKQLGNKRTREIYTLMTSAAADTIRTFVDENPGKNEEDILYCASAARGLIRKVSRQSQTRFASNLQDIFFTERITTREKADMAIVKLDEMRESLNCTKNKCVDITEKMCMDLTKKMCKNISYFVFKKASIFLEYHNKLANQLT